jgi:predicted kinase
MTTRLKAMLQANHWQGHRAFCVQYDRVALTIDPMLQGSWPSRAQLHRWMAGEIKRLPYADHCSILEGMFPGWTAVQLFECSDEESDSVVLAGAAVGSARSVSRDTRDPRDPFDEARRAIDQILDRMVPVTGVVTGMTARHDKLRDDLLKGWSAPSDVHPSIILVAGYAGCGKTEFSNSLASLTGWAAADKDAVTRPLVESLLVALGSDANDRRSDLYLEQVRPLEYHCLMETAFQNLERGVSTIVSAPFLSEVADEEWMQRLVNRCASIGADVTNIWVQCDAESMHEYLIRRGAARDSWKLAHWTDYLATIDLDLRPVCDHFRVDNRLNSALSLVDRARGLAS